MNNSKHCIVFIKINYTINKLLKNIKKKIISLSHG